MLLALMLYGCDLFGGGEEDTDALCESCDDTQPAVTYAFSFSGNGYTPHDGQTVYVKVQSTGGTVVVDDSDLILEGAFFFTYADVLEDGVAYDLYWYADVDADGACTTTDHVWSMDLGVANDDVLVDDPHDTAFDPSACDQFAAE
jgi:hypothetical protein